MKNIILTACLIPGFLATACKKESQEAVGRTGTIIKTEKGIAKRGPDHKLIGPAGGTIFSSDGALKVIVPAGALTEQVDFMIQPISNTLYENDENRMAYRLLPEGVRFSKPVSLVFTYDDTDIEASGEDLLTIAWQQEDGSWKVEPSSLNKQAKTLSAETSHFSDWTVTGGLEMRVEKQIIKPTEQSMLSIVSVNNDDLLSYLSVSTQDDQALTALGNWKIVEGTGTVQEKKAGPRGFAYTASYTAPASIVSTMNVVITAEAVGFNKIKDPSAPGGIRQTGKMILFGRLIVSENFMTGTLDGVPFGFFGDKVSALGMGGAIVVTGTDATGEVTLSASANSAGNYPCGQVIEPGKAGIIIHAGGGSAPSYSHFYFTCGPTGDIIYSPASLQITKWPAPGGTAEGSFNGPVYMNNDVCGARQKQLFVQFRVTRAN